VLGSRDQPPRDTTVRPGVDMMELFPESPRPRGGGSEFNYSDVFLAPDPQNPQGNKIAQPPPPGTMLRYQVRAIDVVGRPSANWTLTDSVRLEKHESPPLPSAPDETPADALPGPSLTGVNASVLVRGAQNMTSDDLALLGTSDNIIVLRWGWHAKQRKLDPYATQFRIYLSTPLDEVAGKLVSAAPDPVRPGAFRAHLQLARAIPADAAKGLFLEVGYPFFIETHGGGTDIQATVRTTIAAPGGGFRSPTPGAIRLPLKYSARLTRPDGWKERLQPSPGQAFVPITAAEQYQVVIRDRLVLTEGHPRDVMWAGVSAADDQAYVLDSFTGVSPGGPLPGNESAVAAVLCQGKRMIRPDLQPSLPTGPVPRIITPEPVNGPVRFRLDLGPYLTAAGLPAGALIKPERLHAADLLASFDVTGDALFARPVNPRAGETSQPLSLGNPVDQAAVVRALSAGDFESVDDRFLVVLAQMHPWRERLFEAATNDPINATAFDEALPSGSARYVYRVRTASLAGQLSDDGAVAHAVVRVPSPISGPSPVPDARRQDDPRASLRFRIPNSTRLSHALVFRLVLNDQSANAGGVLLRVPNRPDLYPGSGVQLRLQNDIVLVPTAVALSMLERDAQGWSLPVTRGAADRSGSRLGVHAHQ
jgi:hypothetical protein